MLNKTLVVTFSLLLFHHTRADPKKPMADSFAALVSIIPYLADGEKFHKKENEKFISEHLQQLNLSIKTVKHENLIQQDIFAPSYELVKQNVEDSLAAFKVGKKDYAHWRLKELTSLCLDCHTRLPIDRPSRFDSGQLSFDTRSFSNSYNLGVAQLIVRRYFDAKQSFTKSIDEKLMKGETKDLIKPLKQILLIETKILKKPHDLAVFINYYLGKEQVPTGIKKVLESWKKQLARWEVKKFNSDQLTNEAEVRNFIQTVAMPMKERTTFDDGYDVDHLLISGLLSNYLFKKPKSPQAPEMNYWIGKSEKYLKREHFFGSGDLFFKQCVERYPENSIAAKCLEEYKGSLVFEFSGSSGTHIPDEVKKELDDLTKLLKSKVPLKQ